MNDFFVCLAMQYPLVRALSRYIPLSTEYIFQILRSNEYFLLEGKWLFITILDVVVL